MDAIGHYLDVALANDEVGGNRAWALAAMVELDQRNGTSRSEAYLRDDGPWEHWQRRNNQVALAPVAEIVDLLESRR